MITVKELDAAIAECEGQRHPTANTCVKLAAFHYLRDKLSAEEEAPQEPKRTGKREIYAYGSAEMRGSRSEFAEVIRGASANDVLGVMDDLMATVKILLPSVYDTYIRKLRQL